MLWKVLKPLRLTRTYALASIFAKPKATPSIIEFLKSSDVQKYLQKDTEREGRYREYED